MEIVFLVMIIGVALGALIALASAFESKGAESEAFGQDSWDDDGSGDRDIPGDDGFDDDIDLDFD